MTEAILIEIAQRFRQMEDAVEASDTIGAARHQLTETVEACREDMVAMQEALRKCGGVK